MVHDLEWKIPKWCNSRKGQFCSSWLLREVEEHELRKTCRGCGFLKVSKHG